jgi:hypothetical protein
MLICYISNKKENLEMRKIALALVLLFTVSLLVLADDGSVLPANVFRARVIPVFA